MSATVFYESASELATLSNTFKVGTTATDPTTVTLTITSPSGVPASYTWPTPATLTHGTAGVFSKDVACSEDGEWQYVWEGTGAASDVVSGTWTVFESDLGKLYATPAALKSRFKISDDLDDFEVHAACFSASRSVEQYCERHFWRTPAGTVRTFVPNDLWHVKLPEFNDLVSVTSMKTDSSGDGVFETTWQTSDYQLLPHNPDAAPERKPYTMIKAVGSQTMPIIVSGIMARNDRVQITGVFGWPSIPWGIKQAALILAAETLKLKDAPFGVAGFGEFGAVRVRDNPKVRTFADPYCRNPRDDRGRPVMVA